MSGLIVAPDYDHPDEHDSREFVSQARMFVTRHPGTLATFDNEAPYSSRALSVLNALDVVPSGSCSYIATCCHGWRRGVQAGFDVRGEEDGGPHGLPVHTLAEAMKTAAAPGHPLVVPLYSCSTAEDPVNGFAATLSRLLTAAGVDHRVFAHTTAGHAVRNPYVRTFPGGEWLVTPGSPQWPVWVHRLHEVGGTFCFDFPFFTELELRALLGDHP